MPVEIEIKLKVDDLAPVRAKLKSIGAEPAGVVIETNVFFDTPERTLLGQDSGLRLRRSKPTGGGAEKLKVTFKGPRGEGDVKKREEIETGVDNADAVTRLLEVFGYVPQLSFEKRRESWRLERGLVELDTIPQIGSFIEIECPTEADVLKLQKLLGLEATKPMAPTYADMVAHHLSDKGTGETTLIFNDSRE